MSPRRTAGKAALQPPEQPPYLPLVVGLVLLGLVAGLSALLMRGEGFPEGPVQQVQPQVPVQARISARADAPVQTPAAAAAGLWFPPGKGKIAIVLDDWGYSSRHVAWLSSVDSPLTVAVLPELLHTSRVAEAAHQNGHEVILHMPMEALSDAVPREPNTLLASMEEEQILSLLEKSLASVPHARGISNHQGSKATSNPAVMRTVLGEVNRQNLYFLDSFVTAQSVAGEVARQLKSPFARRAVFLDHQDDPLAIHQQLTALAQKAAQQGQAIGIGHDRARTVQVLRAALPALKQAGYTLVPVSELTERFKPPQE